MKRAFSILLVSVLMCGLYASASDGETIYKRVDTEEKKIALTFDDGPHPEHTVEILNILNDYGVKATFFVVGKNAESYPDVLRRIAGEGHEIGNHTYSHINLQRSDEKTIRDEIRKCKNKVLEICECETRLFRPPGGALCERGKIILSGLGFKIVLWSIDTKDWAHRSVCEITENVLSNAGNGSIILFHDYISNGTPTPDALEIIIPALLEKGYEFVTVGELINECQKTVK